MDVCRGDFRSDLNRNGTIDPDEEGWINRLTVLGGCNHGFTFKDNFKCANCIIGFAQESMYVSDNGGSLRYRFTEQHPYTRRVSLYMTITVESPTQIDSFCTTLLSQHL